MVSIIKNQLLKHLSRFTKNLSADKINLSTFKGEGELTNLELNEIVLTDLLELPSWLRLTRAWCNKVSFRIPWTKLKSVPIHLSLDEVNVTVETCEDLRSLSAQGGLSSYTVPGKYAFIHKVIDGITVTVNTVNVLFNSPAFTASVQLQRIVVESKTPKWTRSDLRMTRLKDPNKGQILIFKELEWQTVRIEAKSTVDQNLTPLRLLTNQARCRIIIKKRLSDCFLMGTRFVIILDDLLWVLTDSQLKAALHFLNSLSGLIQKATQITRKAKAARKLEEFPEYQAQLSQEARSTTTTTTSTTTTTTTQSSIFSIHDVVETSYHFLSNQIVLHLCDDPGVGRSIHPNLKDGGALQISIRHFQIDFYPYHLAKFNRKHWPRYNETSIPHTVWQEKQFQQFKQQFFDLIVCNKQQHTPLSRYQQQQQETSEKKSSPNHAQKEIKKRIETQLNKLMTTCIVMRIEDFTLYRVTTSGKKQTLKEFVAGDRDHMSLPKEASIIHAEFIYYYYPSDIPFPLPPPKFYVHVNPIQAIFDVDSCLWLNSFGLHLYQSLISSKKESATAPSHYTYIDVKIEAILPRLNFESTTDHPNQRDRPKMLTFQITRATITNIRSLEQSSRADLAKCIDTFNMGSLFFGCDFPSTKNDFYVVTQKFLDHIQTKDNIRSLPKIDNIESYEKYLYRELLWLDAKDVWSISLDPVWGDFYGAKSVGINKPIPFLDALPITIWLHASMDPNTTITENCENNADIHALAYISNLISLQLNHYQYLFLLRLLEEVSDLITFLSIDSNRILNVESNGSLVIGALIPQLEITFVMPSQCPGKESSGGDVESFVPDTSSIADDNTNIGSMTTVWQTSTLSITQSNDYKKQIPNGSNVGELTRSLSMEFQSNDLKTREVLPQQPQQIQPTFTNINIQNNFNASFTTMKKGFTNLMSSIDSALKSSPDDLSDTLSIRSDQSSDSESYIVINSTLDPTTQTIDIIGSDYMFYVKEFSQDTNTGPVEMASEVLEDDNNTITTTSEHSFASSCRRKDLISVSTFKLNKVEFLQQSTGQSSSIKLQIGNICCDDCSSIPWDEFQSKFNSRARAWSDNTQTNNNNSSSNTTSKIKLRLDHTITLPTTQSLMEINLNDKEYLKRIFQDLITINVNNLNLDLTMSTITGLTDLIEDEIIPTPIPIQISIENVQLHLIEDRPPANITSPGPVPIDLNITQLFITRNLDGIFNISPILATNKLEQQQEQQTTTKQLQCDNEELKRRLVAYERVAEENFSLRKAKEESTMLRSYLQQAQDEVARLLDEKKRLLDEINQLKSRLNETTNRQWTNKR